ncbi:MAG TPA: hypothetical protein VKS82_16930 [Streptosporangiaceae bacterium]|nr:hypothetical protein [Streptosporangiaceae bacterium]
MQSSETTRKAYRGSQLEALYRAIFELQTRTGWQDGCDFTAWYASQGWLDSPIRSAYAGTGAITYVGKYSRPSFLIDENVREYREAMQVGQWQDTSTHPIAVAVDGEVVAGHHRLTAASHVDWATVPNDPLFEVVFGVSISLDG